MLNHETNETPQSHPSIGDVGNSRLDGGHESLKRSERSTGDGGEHRAQKKKVKDKDGKRKKRKGPSQDLSEAGTSKSSRSRNNPSYRGYDEDVGTSSRKTTKKGKKKKVRFSIIYTPPYCTSIGKQYLLNYVCLINMFSNFFHRRYILALKVMLVRYDLLCLFVCMIDVLILFGRITSCRVASSYPLRYLEKPMLP